MNTATENKSAAARFLADHEQLGNDLESARLTLEDQRKEIERLDAKLSIQSGLLTQANTDKNLYLQYSFELAAQLQFIVAGSARALMIAGQVRNSIAMKAANIPPVPGADIAELEDIIHRIGENNAAANDGAGMTNTKIPAMTGAGPQDIPNGLLPSDETLRETVGGTLVDRNGEPIKIGSSEATRMIQAL